MLSVGCVDWKELPIHVIDFEGQRSYGVVEYGIVTLLDGKILRTHTRLCQAWGTIPASDSALHGLYAEHLSQSQPFKQEYALFSALRKEGLLGAHHAPMEQGLLASVWPYPPQAPSFLEAKFPPSWGPWVDTCMLYRKVFPGLERYKLSALIQTFRLEDRLNALAKAYCPPKRSRYHCALYDALASAVLLLNLSENKGFERMPLSWLLHHSGLGPLQLGLW